MNPAFLKPNKWVRRTLLTLLILLLVWLIAWLVVPPIVKGQLQEIASEKLGRQVTVGKIDFKPWTFELALNDLRIATAEGSQTQLAVKRIYVDAELQSILRRAPVIDALRIESPVIQLTHSADGRYDIDDVITRLTQPKPSDASQKDQPRFAIYNIAITDGRFDFNDETVQQRHELRAFALSVPFLSNLASRREIKTEPKLAFVLNGSQFDSSAHTMPFADSRKTDAQIRFQGLDLAPYLGYIPAGLPVALQAGTLDVDLKIDFERASADALKLSGTIAVNGVKVADSSQRDLLGFDALKLSLADVRPLERVVHLSAVELAGPRLVVARDGAGRINLLSTERATRATDKVASAEPAESQPWRLQVDKVALRGGQIGWRDQSTRPAAAIDVQQLALELNAITWPIQQPAKFSGSAWVGGAALQFNGEASDQRALVTSAFDRLPLSLAAPYLAQSLVPTLDGKLSGKIDVEWRTADLKVKARSLVAEGLALTQEKNALASVGRVELLDADVDLSKRIFSVASFSVSSPKLRVERDSEKRWMFERWIKASSDSKAKPWQLSIGSLAVDKGALSYADKASATSAVFELSEIQLKAQKLVPNTATPAALKFSGRMAAGRAEAGRFDYDGKLVLKPIATEGQLRLESLPAHAFKAYYGDALNIDIRRAFASYRGSVKFAMLPAGLQLKLAGDSAIDDFRANSGLLTQARGASSNRQLLSWKALGLRGLKVDMVPGAPLALNVRRTSLTDFFARVIIDPSGRLNLLYLLKKPGQEASVDQPSSEVETQRSFDGTSTTSVKPHPDSVAAQSPPAAADSGLTPVISFGPMRLVNGRIDFSDQFVKPNYSADLSELTGKLSAFSSNPQGDQPALAELELRGKAQQTASLEITGKFNPLARPLELDITARMKELDLPPLSPYTIRFAGHGIERGKLSMDVNYKIAPDGALTATNRLVLNQLQFGEPVEGAPASLPVRLAVALLTDRNGVIDIDLPLRGSINDPQFSVGPLIVKAIFNLIGKAVTAPFALLTGGLGGGSGGGDSSTIVFAPGSAELSSEAKNSLDKVVKALNERPVLQLTVTGTSNLDKESEAYQRLRLRAMAQAEKRRAAVRAGKDAAEVDAVTDAEYSELLTAIYKRSEVKKPRNLIGLAQKLPDQEMEDRLLATIAVDEESMRQLALQRGAAVRDYLLAQQLPSERLFTGAVRTQAQESDWKPGAELKLEAR